jgi:hypothetical protein
VWLVWKPRAAAATTQPAVTATVVSDRHGHGDGGGYGETDAERIAAGHGADEEDDTVGHPDKHETRSSAAMTLPETPAVDVSCYCVSS